jgi:hypothetical protein
MGFFDKLKASVGIGGAKIEVDGPLIVTSGAKLGYKVTVRGGKLKQELHGVDVSLEFWPDPATARGPGAEGKPTPGPTVRALGKLPGSEKQTIAPDATMRFEGGLEAPPWQDLYAAAGERYAYLLLGTDEPDETTWDEDGPLPFTDTWESAVTYLVASADIPGAIDPSAKTRVHVLPEAKGPLAPTKVTSGADLTDRLAAAGATRVFVSNASDQWFVWWTGVDGKVVAWSPLQVVCSVRAEGVVLAHDNERIPALSRFPRPATEARATIEGDMADGRAWAEQLVAETRAGVVLPRPVGNAWVALTALRMVG